MFFCSICGAVTATFSEEQGWINHVRAIYITKVNYLKPKLSDAGYTQIQADPVTVLPALKTVDGAHDASPESIHLYDATPMLHPNGTLHPQSSITGYVFHKNCYQLLEWACYPMKVSIETLNLFLRSFAVLPERRVVNWGHTFAGLYISHDPNNRILYHRLDQGHPHSTNIWEANPILTENERILEELEGLTSRHKHDVGRQKEVSPRVLLEHQEAASEMTDIFTGLPAELLEHIMMCLESRDVLSLRLASRIFLAVPLSKAFWRSRFTAGHEFESIIEPWLYKHEIIKDPRFSEPQLVFEAMKNISSCRALANRSRLWELINPLVSALSSFALHEKQYSSIEPCGKPLASLWHPDLDDEDPSARWSCGHGELLDSELQPYHFGCRPLFKRLVTLPVQVESVKVSVLPFHGVTYITGLRFCLGDSREKTIGYILHDREVTLQTGGTLRGFKVTVGERGVHSLCVVNRFGHHSNTAGLAAESQVKVLGLGNRVDAVKAYFDGMKMVFVGVPDYVSRPVGPYSIWKQARDFVEVSNLRNVRSTT